MWLESSVVGVVWEIFGVAVVSWGKLPLDSSQEIPQVGSSTAGPSRVSLWEQRRAEEPPAGLLLVGSVCVGVGRTGWCQLC